MAISESSYDVFVALLGVTDLIRMRCLFFIYIHDFKTGLTVNCCWELSCVEEQSWTNDTTVKSNQMLLLDEPISPPNDVK